MRRLFIAIVLVAFVAALGACSRANTDTDNMKPGTGVTVTLKDGSVVAGRYVQGNADQIVVDPFQGGEWKTIPRNQVASVKQTEAANTEATPQGQQPQAGNEAAQAQPPAEQGKRAEATGDNRRNVRPNESRSARPSAGSGEPMRNVAPAPTATPAAPPQPTFREVTVPADTLLHLRLENAIASDTSKPEDPIRAAITQTVSIEGVEAIPAGSALRGVVTEAQKSGRVKGRASIQFRFDQLMANGDEYRVQTQGVSREAASGAKKDAEKIGIPGAAGAILGGILGGKKGAVIGGAVGGGAGTAVVLSTPGEELRLPAGTTLAVKLLQPITVRVPINR